MRHDAHYVEELTNRATPKVHDEPRPSAVPPEPSLMPRAAWDLASSLDLAVAQAALCASRSAGYAIDVLQADLGRAARVARATAIMLGTPELQRRELDAAALVGKAARATALARRLSGVSLEISIDDQDFRVPVDAALVTQALAGAMDVMLAMLESARRYHDDTADVPFGAAEPLAFSVRCVRTRPAMIIELMQRSVSVDPASIGRFFDPACDLHPGGASAALLLAAAARIIRAHGGRVDVRRDEPVGCTMTFILPQAASRGAEL
jgi:signal transduction histidine kinase